MTTGSYFHTGILKQKLYGKTVDFNTNFPSNLTSSVAEYFSFTNLIDFFKNSTGVETLWVIDVQEYIRLHTTYFIDVASTPFFLSINDTIFSNNMLLHPLFDTTFIKNVSFYDVSNLYVSDLYNYSSFNNNFDNLSEIFP